MAIILRIPTGEKAHFLGTDFVNISLLWKGFTTRIVVKVVIEASRITTRISTGIVYTQNTVKLVLSTKKIFFKFYWLCCHCNFCLVDNKSSQ